MVPLSGSHEGGGWVLVAPAGTGEEEALLAFRETRAVLRRTSTGERCEQHSGPTKRMGPPCAPAAASDESARLGWIGWVLSLFPVQAAEAKL